MDSTGREISQDDRQRASNCDMIQPDGFVRVPRVELESERRLLLSRLHILNKLLGLPPILTGKERRRQE